jgi:proteasome lid subunit RPN8/RPN11
MAKDKSSSEEKGFKQSAEQKLSIGNWKDSKRPAYRQFPGPLNLEVPLRVTFEAEAYADFIAHARSSLDVEICGVLVGNVYQDDYGNFVAIKAIIAGEEARRAGTHVTFTQETWTNIHETLERHYSKMQIVGWYHSHPGFGVEFSDMDLFIHSNFFSAPTQIALLTDPLNGEVAIRINTAEGVAPLDRFWVNGREVRCQIPISSNTSRDGVASQYSSHDIQALETRLNQFMRQIDDQKNKVFSFVIALAIIIMIAVVGWVVHSIYKYYTTDPVETAVNNIRAIPIPVQIDGKTIILVAQIVGVEMPLDLIKPGQQKTKNKSGEKQNTPTDEKNKNQNEQLQKPDE